MLERWHLKIYVAVSSSAIMSLRDIPSTMHCLIACFNADTDVEASPNSASEVEAKVMSSGDFGVV
jgi:hypothetical protein